MPRTSIDQRARVAFARPLSGPRPSTLAPRRLLESLTQLTHEMLGGLLGGAGEGLALVLLQIGADEKTRLAGDVAAVEHAPAIAGALAQLVSNLEAHDEFTRLQNVARH